MKNFKLNTIATLLSLTAIGTLSGCAATREAREDFKRDSTTTTKSIEGAEPRSVVAIEDPTQEKMSNFGRVQKNWVNPTPLPRNTPDMARARLPSFFQKQVALTMPGKVSLVEILSEMQRVNNFKVSLNHDVYDTTSGNPTTVGTSSSSANKDVVPIAVSDFVFRGTLENALDFLSSKANVSWKWNGSQIELYRYETKSYNITLLAGKTVANSQVRLESEATTTETSSSGATAAGSAAGSASSSANQGVNRTATLDSWAEVKNYLLSLMSNRGTIAVMESTGLVTIKDTPDAQVKIAQAVKDLNSLIGKQIYISVDVYAITKDASDDYGLDWNLAWSSLRNNVNYTGTSGSGGTNTLSIGVLTGPFAGSNVVAQALSKLGKTSVVNQFQITTLNGQPTPIGNNKKIPYISGISTVTDANGNPTQAVTTGAIYQGISMSIIPKVQPNGKILLEYAMNLSDFQGFTRFDTGTGANSQSLNLPTTTLKNILQRASLRSGQALVLSGFKQSLSSTNSNGIGSPSNYFLGGSGQGQKQEQYLVITVTPFLAQDNE